MKKYLKKFGIMFVMIFTITLGTCISAFADDTSYSWNTYDDTNANFIYENLDVFNNGDSGNFLNGEVHETSDTSKQSLIKFNFIGNQFKIDAQTYSNGRNNNVNVYIDGNLYTFSAPQVFIHGWATIFTSPVVSSGEHSVVIEKNEGDLFFDVLEVNGEIKPYNDSIGRESISLNKSSMDLSEGDSGQLIVTTTPAAVGVTWKSSDPSVATVDSTGKVTAIGAGTATITATTTDGSNLSASCAVNVTANSGGNNGGTTTGAGAIVNIAYAKGDNTNNAGGDVSIIFNGVPDTTLSVVKTASVKSVWVGDTFMYTIAVTNTGSKTAKAVVINDSAPNHIQFMPSGITTTQGTVDPSSSASKIVVNVGDIPPSGIVTITVPATVVL